MSSATTNDERVVADALAAGLVVALPTDTVYGLGVSLRHGSVADLVAAKRRPDGRPIAVLVGSIDDAAALGQFGGAASALVEQFWPGPLTVVVPRANAVGVDLGGAPDTIGLRCPADPALLALLGVVGPLAVTSANRSGEPELVDAAAIREAFGDEVPVVWDDGPRAGTPSTVVRCVGSSVEVLRAGGISVEVLAASGVPLA